MPWTDYAAEKFANEGLDGVDGTSEATAYEISNAAELALLASRINDSATAADWNTKYYKLTNDIFLAQHDWITIGTNTRYFVGSFDGQGHSIFGLYINNSQMWQGLFGSIYDGAIIKNLKLQSGVVESTNAFVGSLIGLVSRGTTTIENIESNVVVKGNANIGGLVGGIQGVGGVSMSIPATCNISNCSYTGYVYGTISVGGIMGMGAGGASRATLTNCTTNCYVSGTQVVGALTGNNGSMINCVAKGTIDGPGNIIVGSSGTVIACSFYGSATDDTLTLPDNAVACWAVVNDRKLCTSASMEGDDLVLEDVWAENWVVVPELNNGLPMQKGLFWINCEIVTPVEKFKESLAGFGVA